MAFFSLKYDCCFWISNLEMLVFFFTCRLTETELKFELLEKDPYAFDVPNTAFGRGSLYFP